MEKTQKNNRLEHPQSKMLMGVICLLLLIFLINGVSALELNPFAKVTDHEKNKDNIDNPFLIEKFNDKYGVISISGTIFWIDSGKIAEYSLIENSEQCGVTCSAYGKATLYSDGKLFEGVDFVKAGETLQQLSNVKYWIKQNQTTLELIPDTYKQLCKDTEKKYCSSVPDKYKEANVTKEVWVEYNYEDLPAGNYDWELTGEKDFASNIDFRLKSNGKTLSEWAWWNGTGGTMTFDGAYTVVTFTSSGQFMWAGDNSNVSVLVVGGGAGGANPASGPYYHGGGGGAGGYLNNSTYFVSAQNYTIYVGAGGARGVNGSNSTFGSLVSVGGGAGRAGDTATGDSGASGGGGGGTGIGGAGTAGQGNNGGAGTSGGGWNSGGGAGGSGSAGEQGTQNVQGGDGGNGTSSSITGTAVYYAAGGSGNLQDGTCGGAIGGRGGGGNCTSATQSNAINGTGSGGGLYGGAGSSAGGSGIVIIRYLTATAVAPTVTLNQPTNGTTSTSSTIVFNITGSDDITLQNLSLIVNGSYISTNSSPINNTKTSFTYTLPSNGFYNWTGEACDNTGLCTNASVFYITITNNIAVSLNEPTNSSTVYSPSVLFNMTGADDTALQNLSLIVNGSYISTNSSPINNTKTGFTYSLPTRGLYNWSGQACDNAGTCINTSANYLWFNTSITVALNQPANTYNSSSQSIMFNATASDDTTVQNMSFILNGTYNGTNTSVYNNTLTQFLRTLPDGFYNWTVEACDNLGYCSTATTRNITIDSVVPAVSSNSSTTYTFQAINTNLPLYWTITDTNLAQCYIEWYNGTNSSITCATGSINVNTTGFYTPQNLTFWANDTFGNWNSAFVNWTYNLFDWMNYTYDTSTIELSSETFTGDFQSANALSSSYLQYNNTNYSASSTSLGSNRYILSKTITVPAVNVDTNFTWFFWFNNINATTFNQTVLNANLSTNCSLATFPLVYYYLEDELTQVLINNSNSSIESSIKLTALDGTIVYQLNNTYSGNSTPIVCSGVNLSGTGLRIWEQSRYGSTNYKFEQHNVQNATITAPLNYTLLDLPTSSATVFKLTYKSATFLPVENAVVDIERNYIGEGIFKSIESPVTDGDGEVSASLDLNAVSYRVIIKLNGTILSTFENILPFCSNLLTGDCTINLNARQTINTINTFDILNDFSYGLTQSNRTITLTYNIPSGATKNVSLIVNQSTILANTTSCVQYTVATTGLIQCTINATLGDVFATVQVNSGGVMINTFTTTIYTDRNQYFGTDNIVLTFFLVLSLTLLMVSDAIAVLIGLGIGIVASSLMLFLNSGSMFGSTSIIMYVIIVIVLLIIKIGKREKS